MIIPVFIAVLIPIFFGIVYVSPFELPEKIDADKIPENPSLDIFFLILFAVWIIFMVKIIIQIKKRQFRFAQKY